MTQPHGSEFQPYVRGGKPRGSARVPPPAVGSAAVGSAAIGSAQVAPDFAALAAQQAAAEQAAQLAAQQWLQQQQLQQQHWMAQQQQQQELAQHAALGQQLIQQQLLARLAAQQAANARPDVDEEDDDERAGIRGFLTRLVRPERPIGWLPRIAIALVVLMVLVVPFLPSKDPASNRSAKPSATANQALASVWSSDDPLVTTALQLVDDQVIAVECAGESAGAPNPDDCVLRARGVGDGEPVWELEEVFGTSLVAVGDRIVVSGGSQTVVVARDGKEIGKLGSAALIGYNDTTAVFYERGGTPRLVGIKLKDGATAWQEATSAAPADRIDEVNLRNLLTIPSGFGSVYARDLDASDTLVVTPTAQDEAVVRNIDNGTVVAKVPNDGTIVAVSGELVLTLSDDEGKRVLTASAGEDSKWQFETGADAEVAMCGALVCVANADDDSVLLDPETGSTIAKHDGFLLARTVGDVTAIVECGTANSSDDYCPLDLSTVKVVVTETGKKLHSGRVPAFAAADGDKLLLGTGSLADEEVSVVRVSGTGKPAALGRLTGLAAVVTAEDVGVDSTQIESLDEIGTLANLWCAASSGTMTCATRWQPASLRAVRAG